MEYPNLFKKYNAPSSVWDEMYDQTSVRQSYQHLYKLLESIPCAELGHKEEMAKRLFMSQGITFTGIQQRRGH